MACSAAAVSVAVRHARSRQEPLRKNLEDFATLSEASLDAQRVCLLRLSLVSCEVDGVLAGRRLKVKCRADGQTLLKSRPCQVDAEIGQLTALRASDQVLYEGSDTMDFQLCESRRLRSSVVVATAQLSLAEVFSRGLGGTAGHWSLPLIAGACGQGRQWQRGAVLGKVKVEIGCQLTRLGRVGGRGALRSLRIPPRPSQSSIFSLAEDMQDRKSFCNQCSAVQLRLQQSLDFATATANAAHDACEEASTACGSQASTLASF